MYRLREKVFTVVGILLTVGALIMERWSNIWPIIQQRSDWLFTFTFMFLIWGALAIAYAYGSAQGRDEGRRELAKDIKEAQERARKPWRMR